MSKKTKRHWKKREERRCFDNRRLPETPVSSMCGCFYLPLDEAGGGVGGCAAIRAFEAALPFRQLPGQLRASRRHKVQLHTLVFLLFPRPLPVQPPQHERCSLCADRPRGWIRLQVHQHFRHFPTWSMSNDKTLINVLLPVIYVQQQAYVLFMIAPTASSPIVHQSAVLVKAGVEKKRPNICAKKNASVSTTSSS